MLPKAPKQTSEERAANLERVRTKGLVLRCAFCPGWRATDLKTQREHRRKVHGIDVQTSPRGKRTVTRQSEPTSKVPEICVTCGEVHRAGKGFLTHEGHLARAAKLAAAASRPRLAAA